MPDGTEKTYDIRDEGGSASVLAFTLEEQVILTRQFRPGPGKVVLDLPCGAIDGNESPIEAARRELLEETGYQGDLEWIGTCLEDAYSTKIRHNFVATKCKQVEGAILDQNEFIEPVLLSLEAFRVHLRTGELMVVETGYLGLEGLGLIT